MAVNNLGDAYSKLGTVRWLQTVLMPGMDSDTITHQHLLRSMEGPMDHQGAVDDCVAHLTCPLIDDELSVVFGDLATVRSGGLIEICCDVRRLGVSKWGKGARRFMLGVVQTAGGMLTYIAVFDGVTPTPRRCPWCAGCYSATRPGAGWCWWRTAD